MKIRELAPFGSLAIEVRRGETLRAEHADVGVALVVRENDDDVRRAGRSVRGQARKREERNEHEESEDVHVITR